MLGNQRAEYGKQIVATVSTQLQDEYGKKGFGPRSIWRMMQFATLFPDSQIFAQLARKLFWMLYPYGDLLWTDMFGYVCLKQVNPKFARLCTMAYGYDKDWGLYCPKYLFLYDNQRILQTKQSLH